MRHPRYPTPYNVLLLLLLLVVPLAAAPSWAGVPTVANITITDVTTRSFSVVWQASEASTASLRVFANAPGTIPATEAIITPHPVESGAPAIRLAAEDRGVMKVRVTGLQPDTEYFFQTETTSISTGETLLAPAVPLAVQTEVRTVRARTVGAALVPFSNDLLLFPSLLPDGLSPAAGALLVIAVAGARHPVSGFVGDGVPAPHALLDMNNFFSAATNETLDLTGSEVLTIREFRGLCANAIGPVLAHARRVPLDNELSEVTAPAVCFSPTNIPADFNCDGRIGSGDFNLFLAHFGLSSVDGSPDCQFNADFDLSADGRIGSGDFNLFLSVFGASE